MTLYLEILAGIWTFLAMCWTVAILSADNEAGKDSKLERFVQSKEDLVSVYDRDAR